MIGLASQHGIVGAGASAFDSIAAHAQRPLTGPGRFDDAADVDFKRTLEHAVSGSDARRNDARNAAEQLVATAFIQPMLATLRDATFGSEMFEPGLAEQRFGPMFDQHMADRITNAANLPLVDVIVDRLVGPPPAAPPTVPPAAFGTQQSSEVIDVSA